MATRIVIDTNVLVSALRSKRGASHKLLMLVDSGAFETAISVPLVLEYEAAARRCIRHTGLTPQDADAILDYVCACAVTQKIFYLWRPVLSDARDDMVLELAVAAGCKYIVTFNLSDFAAAKDFGVRVLVPRDFLTLVGESS